MVSTDIGDLALIGDRRTAAILARDGTVLWYCPGRFDHPSLLAGLLDPGGGAWRIELPGAASAGRRYLGDSGVLETHLRACGRDLTVTDWMPAGPKTPRGLVCRLFSATPNEARIVLEPRPDYGRAALSLDHRGRSVRIGGGQCLSMLASFTAAPSFGRGAAAAQVAGGGAPPSTAFCAPPR
jgi:hypothetical protein